MSTPLNVDALSGATIDRSDSYQVSLGLGSTLLVTRDAGTPALDPVQAVFDTLSVSALSSVEVQNARLVVNGLADANVLSTFRIGDGGRLDFADTVGVNIATPIRFEGAGGVLSVDRNFDLGALNSITGFNTDDVISFTGVTGATDVRYDGGRLSLLNDGVEIAGVDLTGDFDPTLFGFQSDGRGNTNVGIGLGNGGGMENDTFATGLHTDYLIARTGLGQLYLQDEIAGRDAPATVTNGRFIVFVDGVGRFDSSGVAQEVAHLYEAAFDRRPDASGLEYWTSTIESGALSERQVALAFSGQAEFQGTYGGLDDAGYVGRLYENVLGRPGDTGGINYWVGEIEGGATRADVLMQFAHSFENVVGSLAFTGDREYGQAYRLYEAALDRQPETGGLSYWYTRLEGGDTLRNVAQGFIDSAEFNTNYGSLNNENFIDRLYLNVLERTADAGGREFWLNTLANGSTRADVLIGFSESLENRIQTADATHDNWIFLGAS